MHEGDPPFLPNQSETVASVATSCDFRTDGGKGEFSRSLVRNTMSRLTGGLDHP